VDYEITHRIFKVQVQLSPDQMQTLREQQQTAIQQTAQQQLQKQKSRQDSSGSSGKKLGRNDPCPCGSGKKYKKCHYPIIP